MRKTKIPWVIRLLIVIIVLEIGASSVMNLFAEPNNVVIATEATTEVVIEPVVQENAIPVVGIATVPVVEETVEAKLEVDEDEVYLMAQLMTAETGGASEMAGLDIELEKLEMLLVGKTAQNREKSNSYDFKDVNTLEDVISQSGQYPETWEKIQNEIQPTELALETARQLLEGSITEFSVTYQGEVLEFVFDGEVTEIFKTEEGKKIFVGDDIYWQTGFVPNWGGTEVMFETEWHVYSREET